MEQFIIKDIMLRLTNVFKSLSPKSLEFMDFDKHVDGRPLIQVCIVANGLEDIRSATRWRICEDLLHQRDPQLAKEYIFAFEAFTPREYSTIRVHKHTLN